MNMLIADDHAMHRELMHSLLKSVYPDATIVEAENYMQVESACARYKPSLVVLDVFMPGMDGLVGVSEIIRQFPSTNILICSAIDNPILMQTLMAFGAKGYVAKTMSAENLLKGIRAVLNGESYIPENTLTQTGDIHLTQRQWEILGMVCLGLTNKEIARRLNLSISTVKFHVGLILEALNVQNRQQAISICTPG